MNNLIVVSSGRQVVRLGNLDANASVITADEYLRDSRYMKSSMRVFNLCNDYSYCKKGYYVSLLAEARHQRPIPSVATISDLHNRDTVKVLSSFFFASLNKALKDVKAEEYEISVYWGRNFAQKLTPIARQIFNIFQAPLMRVFCKKIHNDWQVKNIALISYKDVPEAHHDFLMESANLYFGTPHARRVTKPNNFKYDLAILVNPEEELPPSDEKAIKHFVKAARDLRIYTEVIGPKDFALLNRFDSLFIRETTSVVNHTYRFAKKAELEGLVVMDDPQSILRCCNKIYLHDLLTTKHISTPKTDIVYKDTDLSQFTSFPLVIKKPDSAFSAGVQKVNSIEELHFIATEYFKKSDLIILQEFLQTDFDWRIGVIDNKPLYACRYHMAKNHWQVIKRENDKTLKEGKYDTYPLHQVPKKAVQLALKACKEIGNSLYGVDIKEKDGQFYVIEVNDNPSIEKGVEDKVLGHELYHEIMKTFLNRLDAR